MDQQTCRPSPLGARRYQSLAASSNFVPRTPHEIKKVGTTVLIIVVTGESDSSILPYDLIEETLRPLGLLIPFGDKESRAWFRKKQRELGLDPRAGTYGPLNAAGRQIEDLKYWRDRLIILKQIFDEPDLKTILLLWRDDRNKVQWCTFWIAALILALTIVFGLTQSVAGIVQSWAAVRSLPS